MDYPAIVKLHQANLWRNLSPEERLDGFLSVGWDRTQIEAANHDLAVMVAESDSSIIGYLGGTTIAYSRQFPLLNAMIELYPEIQFQGRSLAEYQSFVYGPICIHTHYRGTGVLQALFQALLKQVAGQYDVGIAFVSQQNPRSWQAHTQKLGMEVLRDFEFKGNSYGVLGFVVPPSQYVL